MTGGPELRNCLRSELELEGWLWLRPGVICFRGS